MRGRSTRYQLAAATGSVRVNTTAVDNGQLTVRVPAKAAPHHPYIARITSQCHR